MEIDPKRDARLSRYLAAHPVSLHSIHTQPFLGDGILGRKHEGGWEIMIYPGRYYDGTAPTLILEVLEEIHRKETRYEAFQDEAPFEDLLRLYLPEIGVTEFSASSIEDEFWNVKDGLECIFDQRRLLTDGYWSVEDLTWVVSCPGIGTKNTCRALGAVAVLRNAGESADDIILDLAKRHEYKALAAIDDIESCLIAGTFNFATVRTIMEVIDLWVHAETPISEVMDDLQRLFSDRFRFEQFLRLWREDDTGVAILPARIGFQQVPDNVAAEFHYLFPDVDSLRLVEQVRAAGAAWLFLCSAEREFVHSRHLRPNQETGLFEHDLTPLVINYLKSVECFLRFRMCRVARNQSASMEKRLERMTLGQLRRELLSNPTLFMARPEAESLVGQQLGEYIHTHRNSKVHHLVIQDMVTVESLKRASYYVLGLIADCLR
jgi:hypothetical protein